MKDIKDEITRRLKILDNIMEVTRPSTYYLMKTYELADIECSNEEGWEEQWWMLNEYTKDIISRCEDARYDILINEHKKLTRLLEELS